MSVLLKLEMPEGAFSALRLDPEGLAKDTPQRRSANQLNAGLVSGFRVICHPYDRPSHPYNCKL